MSVVTTASHASTPSPSAESVGSVIEEMLGGLRYGTIQITVHDGRVVQIDRTERRRLDRGGSEPERRP